MKRILWATDGSENAGKAEKLVREFLDAFPKANLIVLYVIQPVYQGMGIGMVPDMVQDVINNPFEERSKSIESDIKSRFAAYPGRIRFETHFGTAALTICESADQKDVDLIVMGSHGCGVVDRLLLGSVCNEVVHRSHRPTLVVK